MSTSLRALSMFGLVLGLGAAANAASIVSLNVTGGDAYGNATTNGTVKTGDSYLNTNTNANYSVPALNQGAFAYTTRNHIWVGLDKTASPGVPTAANFPSYLKGLDYVSTMQENRDNPVGFSMVITTTGPGTAYLLVDNRVGDNDNANPPAFATNMTWLVNEGWTKVSTGLNRASNASLPDEIAVDESSDGGINQWSSIYSKSIAGNSFTVKEQGFGGINMYGVAFAPIPEPSTSLLGGLAILGLLARRRRA